jgi:acetyltransferase
MSHALSVEALLLTEATRLDDGRPVALRPVDRSDAGAVQAFIRGLSAGSRYRRFLRGLTELAPGLLARFVDVDYRRAMTLVAHDQGEIVAIGQYAAEGDGGSADFAVVVADAWQGAGLGRRLMGAIVSHAARCGFARLEGDALADNTAVLGLVRRFGFSVWPNREERGLVRIARELGGPWAIRPARLLHN